MCLFLASSIFLGGCFSYVDINNVVFVTSIIFDIDEDNNPVIYLEIFKSARAASKAAETGQRVVLRGTGKTAYEALNDVNLASSYEINYTQNKAIIYTRRAAEQGIENYLDIFTRDTQAIIKPYLVVYDGDVERLAVGNFEGEEFIGLFIWDLIINVRTSPRAVQSSLNRYLTRKLSPSRTDVLTVLRIDNNQAKPTLIVDGGAIMKNDKLVELLPNSQGEAYNFLVDALKRGSMEVADPRDSSKYISLSIEKSKTNTEVNMQGDNVNVTKKINVTARIVESQKYIDLTEKEIDKIRQGAEANLINAGINLFNKYKKRNLDIFMIGQSLENKYGEKALNIEKDVIKHTNMKIEPKVFIDSPGRLNRYQ